MAVVADGRWAIEMQGSNIMKPWQFAVVGLALLATSRVPERSEHRHSRTTTPSPGRRNLPSARHGARSAGVSPSCEERPGRAFQSRPRPRNRNPPVCRRGRVRAAGQQPPPPKIELPSQPERGVPDRFKPPPDSAPLNVPEAPGQFAAVEIERRQHGRPDRWNGASRRCLRPAAQHHAGFEGGVAPRRSRRRATAGGWPPSY